MEAEKVIDMPNSFKLSIIKRYREKTGVDIGKLASVIVDISQVVLKL